MKKTLTIIFITLVILYSISWFVIAKIMEDKIPNAISKITSQENDIKKLSVPIKVKGFPFHFDIALEHPNILFNPSDHKGSYNILYDGNIRVRLGLFSKSIKIITSGDLHAKGYTNNYNFHIVARGDNTNYRISLKHFLLNPRLYDDFAKASKDSKFIMNIVDKITIHAEDLKTINKVNNEQIISANHMHFEIKGSVEENAMDISYKEDLQDVKFHKEFLTLWANLSRIPAIRSIIQKVNPDIRNYFATFSLPILGEIDHEIDLDIEQNKSVYEVKINKLIIKDDIEDINVKGDIYKSEKIKIDIKSNAKFTSKFTALIQQYLNISGNSSSSIKLPFSKGSPIGSLFAPLGGILGASSGNTKSYSFPELHNMGTIKLDTDIVHKEFKDNDFNLDINNFDLSTNKFEISAKGNVKERSSRDIYDLKIRINNYNYIFNEALEYVEAEKANAAGPFGYLVNIEFSDKIKNEIKALIVKFSNNPDTSSQSLSWTIKNDGSSKYPAMGRYSSSQVEGEINALISRIAVQAVTKNVKQLSDVAKSLGKGGEGIIAGDGSNSAQKVIEGLSSVLGF